MIARVLCHRKSLLEDKELEDDTDVPVPVTNGHLPNYGGYTYSKKISHHERRKRLKHAISEGKLPNRGGSNKQDLHLSTD